MFRAICPTAPRRPSSCSRRFDTRTALSASPERPYLLCNLQIRRPFNQTGCLPCPGGRFTIFYSARLPQSCRRRCRPRDPRTRAGQSSLLPPASRSMAAERARPSLGHTMVSHGLARISIVFCVCSRFVVRSEKASLAAEVVGLVACSRVLLLLLLSPTHLPYKSAFQAEPCE